tara:strand:- start:12021 stop:12695 length:675 start_codon:yes stop_codon:yes gene_type:complete
MRSLSFVAFGALVFACVGTSNGAVVTYDEITDGMFSTNNLAPTDLGVFGVGINSVSGSISDSRTANRTSDFFSFEIAPGTQLESMYIREANVSTNISFVGLEEGSTFPYLSIDDFGTIQNDYMAIGAMTFGDVISQFPLLLFDSNMPSMPNSNRPLLDLAEQNGAPAGVEIPLGPGTYTFFAQEWNATSTYTVEFGVAAIPEPSSFAVLAIAGSVTAMRRRRRR